MNLIEELGKILHPYNRKKAIGSIMILRAKGILYPITTIKFFLKQFNIEDKELRKQIFKEILNDIRKMNKHHKNNQINLEIKNYMAEHISKNSDKMAQKSIQLLIELYKRNIWTDNRTINIIAEGCFSSSTKIRLISAYFLIQTTEPIEDIEDSSD